MNTNIEEIKRVIGKKETTREKIDRVPWWLIGIILIAAFTVYTIITNPDFNQAFSVIKAGILVTITTSITAYCIALAIGLVVSMARISKNMIFRNLAIMYIEIIRGIPMLVLIFFIAYVGVPSIVNNVNAIGQAIIGTNPILADKLNDFNVQNIPMNIRAVTALSITYGAFLAEIFRAGIQSVGKGQMEAARSLGMNYSQAMRHVILPQAIRNVLPALGNDFVAMVKDSSLVSILAVRDITQIAKLYAGRTFRFREAYATLAVLYLTMTVSLSMLLKFFEGKMRKND